MLDTRKGDFMLLSSNTFVISGTESLPPDEAKAGDIFSRLGYTFADAVADLVDNSVDAEASVVLIRFIRSASGIHSVVIADNGKGMTAEDLKEAMRFGSRSNKSGSQLGKYGIGLKSASLSQADVVTVLSEKSRKAVGRRWRLENIKDNWTCEILAEDTVVAALKGIRGPGTTKRFSTVVLWERLEHLRALPEHIDQVLEKTRRTLSVELGIRFHRFIENETLEIYVDEQFAGEDEVTQSIPVLPLNPFSYESSGNASYPINLKLSVDGSSVVAECHIWPPRSSSPGYKLGGGKVALRQGFYFYRNDRVIQAGGWNGIRADDGEPHLSLARVRIDLPSSLDSLFKLDVTKSRLDPSPSFIAALLAAKSGGVTFGSYIEAADRAYRKNKTAESAKIRFVPANGISANARRAVSQALVDRGSPTPSQIKFRWASLDLDEVFRIDSSANSILLNTRFKRQIVDRSGDAPMFKILLLLYLQNDLSKSFLTKKSNDWLSRVNRALIASVKE
jgi:hypothetical protein